MDYIELKLQVTPSEPWIDLIAADLGSIDFESFETNDNELKAYVTEQNYNQSKIDNVLRVFTDNCKITSTIEKIKSVNWNEEWEKNFDPIFVDDKVVVRSSFHKIEKKFQYEVFIDPKMSFGTGHHATTYLMMQKMLQLDFSNKSVLDMGCGTAVLAILAKKMGADNVVAIDIDDWAYENSKENILINKTEIDIEKGGAELLGNQQFNVILANINLNILLADMDVYKKVLKTSGNIVFSGVLEHDKQQLKDKAKLIGLNFVEEKQKDKWMMFHFIKN